ncbi:hypothetical protein L0Y49_03625, partial [bacterium]|nr:hypothetical protein [bacterium]
MTEESLQKGRFGLVVAATGAGAGIQSFFHEIPGSSRFFLGAHFPYSETEFEDFIGTRPKQFVSDEGARLLAEEAFRRAARVIEKEKRVLEPIGLGLSASIASNRPKRGDYRVFVAVATRDRVSSMSVLFPKRDDGWSVLGREIEIILCDLFGFTALYCALGASDGEIRIPPGPVSKNFHSIGDGRIKIVLDETLKHDIWSAPLFWPDGRRSSVGELSPDEHILFYGAYNPLHEGHKGVRNKVEKV